MDRRFDDGPASGSLERLARPEPLRMQLESALRELIINRVYEPGHHMAESEIAKRLKVSRQPVREALQALQREGWLDLHVGRGAFVHAPTRREVNEVFAVRRILEQEAIRLATPGVDTEGVAELREISRVGRAAVIDGDDRAAVTANARFHRCIAQFADNHVLSAVLESLDHRIRWYFTPLVQHRGTASWDEHDAMITAMEQGAVDCAAELMGQHTENTRGAYNAATREG